MTRIELSKKSKEELIEIVLDLRLFVFRLEETIVSYCSIMQNYIDNKK